MVVYHRDHRARLLCRPRHRTRPTIHSGTGARPARAATPRAQMPGSRATMPMHTPCWSISSMTTSLRPWNRRTSTATTRGSRAQPTVATRQLSTRRWRLRAARVCARSACPALLHTCTRALRFQIQGGHECARASLSRARRLPHHRLHHRQNLPRPLRPPLRPLPHRRPRRRLTQPGSGQPTEGRAPTHALPPVRRVPSTTHEPTWRSSSPRKA